MLTIFIGVIPRKCIYTVESPEVHSAHIIMVYRSSTKDLNAPGNTSLAKCKKNIDFMTGLVYRRVGINETT